jgi:hypothetical protein
MNGIKKSKNMYVNNADFYKAIVQYKKDCRLAKKNNEAKPKIPDILGKQLLLIAENLSHKSWFSSYPFKEELIGDAIENCILYFDNFNPKKYKNPFAYFTQIIYFAFRRRIIKERKQLYTKYKFAEHQAVLGEQEQSQPDEDGMARQQFEQYDNITDFIKNFEDMESEKKKKISEKKNK